MLQEDWSHKICCYIICLECRSACFEMPIYKLDHVYCICYDNMPLVLLLYTGIQFFLLLFFCRLVCAIYFITACIINYYVCICITFVYWNVIAGPTL